ncbi:hypothetical protein GW17_00001435, partial [Ensete ventricosum]
MAALKRAFADVILNTAKESAARILASDRRVLQLQQSMSLAREESLDMLLRLKSIMDSKVMALSPISHSSTSVQFSLWQKIAFRGALSSRDPVCILISEVIDDAVSDDVKNGTLLQEIMLSKPDDKLAEDLGTSITKEGHDDCKDEPCKPCGPAAEDRCDKILKYTFQRKRKRVSLDSKVDFTSLEESMSKQTVEKDNAVLDPQKSSLLVESSRESRRLAQVARQKEVLHSSIFRTASLLLRGHLVNVVMVGPQLSRGNVRMPICIVVIRFASVCKEGTGCSSFSLIRAIRCQLHASTVSSADQTNRSAKLKQCKLDARREQWLSQGARPIRFAARDSVAVKSKDCVVRSRAPSGSPPLPHPTLSK